MCVYRYEAWKIVFTPESEQTVTIHLQSSVRSLCRWLFVFYWHALSPSENDMSVFAPRAGRWDLGTHDETHSKARCELINFELSTVVIRSLGTGVNTRSEECHGQNMCLNIHLFWSSANHSYHNTHTLLVSVSPSKHREVMRDMHILKSLGLMKHIFPNHQTWMKNVI